MKKILAVLLCLSMLIATSACVAETAAQQPLKVALCIANTLGDLGFYDSANEALNRLVAEYGVIPSVTECVSDGSRFEPAIVNAALENDVVIAVGWEFWTALEDNVAALAEQRPDTKFIFIDNDLLIEGEGGKNLLSVIYSENQGSFLAGYIAMKLAANKTIGVVGGEDQVTINNFIVGYKQGALYADPTGTVLDPVYTGTYDDTAQGLEAALSLYGKGADVVFQVAGKTGLGVFDAAKSENKDAIGVDSDQKYYDPEHVVCSMQKLVGDSVYKIVSEYITNGTFAGGTIWEADLSTGLVGIGYGDDAMTQQVSAELKAEVEAIAQKIISGEIIVESTR